VTCYIPRWFTRPQTVTHPGTNRARCRLTSFNAANHYSTPPPCEIWWSIEVVCFIVE